MPFIRLAKVLKVLDAYHRLNPAERSEFISYATEEEVEDAIRHSPRFGIAVQRAVGRIYPPPR